MRGLLSAVIGGWLILASLVSPVRSAALAGAIRGRVDVPEPLAPVARRPSVGELGTPPPRDLPDRRRSIVYLETARAAPLERQPRRGAIDQRNETFVPHVLAVTAGTLVDFPNGDATYHNVFSLSRAASFDLGRYARGRSKSVRFDRPGIVRVFCDIHSHMSAFVLVFNHDYYASTAPDGTYRINDVPPGDYTVAAWNEVLAPTSRPVTILDAAGDVEVNFVLRRK
jgi:plastocyanin